MKTTRRSFWNKVARFVAVLSLLAGTGAVPSAVGAAWYDSRLLVNGGAPLLDAPEAVFVREIQSLHPPPPRNAPTAVDDLAPRTPSQQSADAETDDLRAALRLCGFISGEVEAAISRHQAQRDKLQAFMKQREAWQDLAANGGGRILPPPPALAPDAIQIEAALPAEFADYFRGAIAWHSGDTNGACLHWQRLLKRPASERPFRSTWAAFMLGKATWETDPSAATEHFRNVRRWARAGFADRLDLATSSLGWEARIELRRQAYAKAIDLYLDQAATGDPSAYNSLRFAAATAVRNGARSLKTLAAHTNAQRVITAWMISGGWYHSPVDLDGPLKEPLVRLLERQSLVGPPGGSWHTFGRPVLLWLEVVEAVKVRDTDSVEKIALLAYQAEEWDTARRWMRRAPESPTAQWIEAKLLLREQRLEDAAAILAKLARRFPADRETIADRTNDPSELPVRLLGTHRYSWYWWYSSRTAPRRMLGELGALQLAQGAYAEALDALMRAGYWSDAAYVADRVLTIDELKAYVDRFWPEQKSADESDAGRPYFETNPGTLRQDIRHLLAQRLVRARRPEEARSYFTKDTRKVFNDYLAAVQAGRDATRSAADRAASLWRAAQIAAGSWLEIFDAPVETDWRIADGQFDYTIASPARLTPAETQVLPVPFDERLRNVQTAVYPIRTWHFRFHAADLAWEAAQLMPDQSDDTARCLWQAGTWLKYLDPQAADRFYKALVRRCSQTELGRMADRKRWFPTTAAIDKAAH